MKGVIRIWVGQHHTIVELSVITARKILRNDIEEVTFTMTIMQSEIEVS